MLIDRTYQHRNFVGNRLAEMLISGNFKVIGRNTYKDLPLYKEFGRLSIIEFSSKYKLFTVDLKKCVERFETDTQKQIIFMTAKEKVSIGKVLNFKVYSEYDLIAAYNHCVDADCVFIKEYVSLNEYLNSIGQKNLSRWNERLRKVRKGRVPGLTLDAMADPDKVGDYKERVSYVYRLEDLAAIYKHFER